MDEGAMGAYIETFLKDDLGLSIPPDADFDTRLDLMMQARDRMGLPQAARDWAAADEVYDIMKLRAPLLSKPETQYSYCGTHYSLLLKVLEIVCGENADSFARRRLFEPLGMMDSHFVLPKEKWPRMIKRGDAWGRAQWLNSDDNCIRYGGNSGLKTTMRDLTRFGQMYLQNGTLDGARVLSPASVREFTVNYNGTIPDSYWKGQRLSSNWSLGWNLREGKKDDLGALRSERAFDHPGAGGARLLVDPGYDLVTAFYLVDPPDGDFIIHGKVANIIYSAMD
jgi:CubicO group peptidase (beta-lactamase class C family)